MADAKMKKFKGNVTKLNYFHDVILTWACNSSNFIYIYYEFSQFELYRHMTSHYVMVTKKLYLDARNNDYIVRCKLGSHTISGCSVTGVGPPDPGKQKKARSE